MYEEHHYHGLVTIEYMLVKTPWNESGKEREEGAVMGERERRMRRLRRRRRRRRGREEGQKERKRKKGRKEEK